MTEYQLAGVITREEHLEGLFQVWIDVNCGHNGSSPDWWWNSPPKPFLAAMREVAECWGSEFPAQVLPHGVNPRPDGRWDNP